MQEIFIQNINFIIIFSGLVLFFLMFIIIFLLIKNKKNIPEKDTRLEEILETLDYDRKIRFQEQESLKSQLRENNRNLREEFYRVNQTVDSKLSESSKELNKRLDTSSEIMGKLQKELGKMGEIGNKIENLDHLLRAPKSRGTMGEESLEAILSSIFPKNLWQRQFEIPSIGIVDAMVKTTSGIIPIDSKFPLPSFEKMISTNIPEEKKIHQKSFEKDVKKRIDEVAKYISPTHGTLNFAILFLPNEHIYYEASIISKNLQEYSKSKKILLTGPNMMVYVLQMLFQSYQSQEFSKKAQTALSQISGIKAQSENLETHLNILQKHLNNATGKLSETQLENLKLQNSVDKVTRIEIE